MTSLPFVPFLVGAVAVPLAGRRAAPYVAVAAPLAALAQITILDVGDALAVTLFGHELSLLRVDRLSLAFGTVFALAAFLGGVYGLRLMDPVQRSAALVYAGSGLGVVFAGDLLTLFVFWETMAISSTLLIWARGGGRARRSGMRYLQVHLTGGVFLLAGILWHLSETGSLAFEAFDLGPATALILVGFALNAAVPPLHAWLTDAYPEATVAGAVFLSAFTTKAAVYTLARGFPGVELLVWFGVAMALYGVVYAVLENDIRRLLAYHVVSQVGYMVAAVGIGTAAAINGATAHAFAHILYKGLLFMGAGAVLQATGRSKLTELGGLVRAMPLVFTLYMVGAFSISSVPLFSGFVSKELVLHAAEIDGREAVVLLLKLASIGTFLHTGLKLPYFTWLGSRRREEVRVEPLPRSLYVAMGLTAAVNVAIGIAPGAFYRLMPHPVDFAPYTVSHVAIVVQVLVFTALGFWLLLGKLAGEPTISIDTDWFYRRPRRLAERAVAVPAAWLVEAIDRALVGTVRGLGDLAGDPRGTARAAGRILRGRPARARTPAAPGRRGGGFSPATWLLGIAIMLAVGLLLGMSFR